MPDGAVDVKQLLESYAIDVNFTFRKINTEGLYSLYAKAEINYQLPESEKKEGYEMFIECMGIFQVGSNSLNESDSQALLTNSGLVITLNFLRSKLADITAHFPMGKYLLPSIDLKDLIEKKQKALTKTKTLKKAR